jgi:hypothetical protein
MTYIKNLISQNKYMYFMNLSLTENNKKKHSKIDLEGFRKKECRAF